MKKQNRNNIRIGKLKRFFPLAFSLLAICAAILNSAAQTGQKSETLEITANFAGHAIAPDEKIELKFNRALTADEGKPVIFVGNTDFTALFSVEPNNLSYAPLIMPLPVGENKLIVYLVTSADEWKMLGEFPLVVKTPDAPQKEKSSEAGNESKNENEKKSVENSDKWAIEFTPNVSINTKSQNQTVTFPRESAPERNPSADADGQANVSFKISRRGWNLSNKFDFVGASFRGNALRFGELQERAPKIDLSSYLIEFGKGRFKVNFGHVSFGSNRHLINNFTSRGITVTVTAGGQNEISFAAVNGTSIVGFDNFIGMTRRQHSIVSATFAREFFKERPNGLRVEFNVTRGSVLPLANFNQREVNDAEKSTGFGLRVIGSDAKQRLRYEFGFTRSRFTNPIDPLLEQDFNVTPIRPVTRNARFLEASYDFLQGLKLWQEKKLKLTGTFRHEEIQPLFRSIAASTQADRHQNQFEISATFGEINFAYGNLRDRDNLNDIASILKTLNRRRNVVFGIALGSFFSTSKLIKWLPNISYSYEHTHQFGAFLPANGEFRDASQVPDQHSFARSFNAQWRFSSKYTIGFRHNRAFQDNRQPGRDLADFESAATAITFGFNPSETFNLNFDVTREGLRNFEQPRIDRAFRLGAQASWQTPFLKNSTLSANFSMSLAGDTANTNDARNAEFDAQWAYKFGFGREKFKKTEAQFFIRYANRYGDTTDRVFFVSNYNKSQAFNAGLTFNIF